MALIMIKRGKVQGGDIIFSKPLSLPDGTEVIVRIEPLMAERSIPVSTANEDFTALPFFGMWSDREAMSDSAAWTRKERKRWQRRLKRQA
jgi:hypothetical protein